MVKYKIPIVELIAGPTAAGLETFLLDKWQAGGRTLGQFLNGELKLFMEV